MCHCASAHIIIYVLKSYYVRNTYILVLFHMQAIMTIIPPITFTRWEIAYNPSIKSVRLLPSCENSLHSGRQTELLSSRSNCSAQFGRLRSFSWAINQFLRPVIDLYYPPLSRAIILPHLCAQELLGIIISIPTTTAMV